MKRPVSVLSALIFGLLLTVSSHGTSLYKTGNGASTSMYSDFKAKRVGDIVTILIMESNSASETSQVDTNKNNKFDFKLTLIS